MRVWLLIGPPISGPGYNVVDADAPYSKWQLMDAYATSAECHHEADTNIGFAFDQKFLERYAKNLKKAGYPATPRALSMGAFERDVPGVRRSAPAEAAAGVGADSTA